MPATDSELAHKNLTQTFAGAGWRIECVDVHADVGTSRTVLLLVSDQVSF